MTDRKAMQQALDALEQSHTRAPFGADGVVYWEGVKIHEAAITALRERLAQPEHKPMHPTLQKMWEDYFDKCYKRKPEQEPVAWVLPKMHPVMELRAQRGFRVR